MNNMVRSLPASSHSSEHSQAYCVTYEYNNEYFEIQEVHEIHLKLANDSNFFANYIKQQGNKENHPDGIQGNWKQDVAENKFKWTKPSTQLLIDEYRQRSADFRNPKVKKKGLWKAIMKKFNEEGYSTTEDDLDRKWRNMKKTYTSLLDDKKSTGRGGICWEYFTAFDEIYCVDRAVNIQKTVSSPLTIPIQQESADPEILKSGSSPLASPNNLNHQSLAINLFNTPSTSRGFTTCTTSKGNNSASSNQTFALHDKASKRERNKNLYDLRKQLAKIEEKRVEELRLLRLAIENSNKIQMERNKILKKHFVSFV